VTESVTESDNSAIPNGTIFGKWISEDTRYSGNFLDKLELKKDGTGKGEGIKLKWKVENDSLKLNLGIFWGTLFRILAGAPVYNYEISGSTLTLTNTKGRSVKYIPITNTIPNATVTSDTLDLRSDPRMNSKVNVTLKKGDLIYVSGEITKKIWLEAEHKNDEGYVTQDQFAYIFPRLGKWKLTGKSKERGEIVNWTGNMNINEINKNSFSGYFRWDGKGEEKSKLRFYGTEFFRGTYNPKTGSVSIQGYELGSNKGLGLDKYDATLTEDGKDCISGTWASGGTWKAQWDRAERMIIKK